MKRTWPKLVSIFLFLFFFSQAALAQSWMWANSGSSAAGEAYPVAVDSLGDVYAVCRANAPVTFGSTTVTVPPSAGIAWVKYDAAGAVLWAGSLTSGYCMPLSICADESGNLFVYAQMTSTSIQIGSLTLTSVSSAWYTNTFIVKISPNGTPLWLVAGPPNFGGYGSCITTDSAGNVYAAGDFSGPTIAIGPYTLTNTNMSHVDVCVAKYNTAGIVQWASSIGGSLQDEPSCITVSSTGNVYVGGSFTSPSITVGASTINNNNNSSISNVFIAKLSPTGVPLWAESGIATTSNNSSAASLTHDNADNVYMLGDYEGPNISFGTTTINSLYPSAGGYGSFIVKYSPADVVTWSETMNSINQNGSFLQHAYSLAYSPCNKLWASVSAYSNLLIDSGDSIIMAAGYDPLFLVSYDLSGAPSTGVSIMSGGDDAADIACDFAGNVIVCGDVYSSATYPTFHIGPFSWSIPIQTEEMFVAKYGKAPDTSYARTDTTACIVNAGSAIIHAPAGCASYRWDNGSPSPTRNITAIGKYYVYCYDCGNIFIDTFNITLKSADTSFGDTVICFSGSAHTLYAPVGYQSYLWSTGDTTATTVVSSGGIYWLNASQACTLFIDTYTVKIVDLSFSLGNDTSVCGPLILHAPSIAGEYTWQDGSAGSSYIANTTGTYYLNVNSKGCTYADTISLHITDVSQHLHDTVLCREQAVSLDAQAHVPPGGSVLWSDGSKLNTLHINDTGRYWLTVNDSLCTVSDTFNVSSEFCDCRAYMPTAFTPNGDGRDDIYRPIIEPGCTVGDYSFAIYNRWGQQLFLSHRQGEGWDGHFNNAYCEIGAYFWLLKYTGGEKKINHQLKGDMLLLR